MKNEKFLGVLSIILFAFIVPGNMAAAGSASINLFPQAGSAYVDKQFSIVISVNAGSDKIDTVRAKLIFPADLLEIKSFSLNPAFSFQSGANGFDNKAGTFSWGAGVPGGFSDKLDFGTVVFNVLKPGEAKIFTDKDSLVLSSGEDKFSGSASSSSYKLSARIAGPAKNSKEAVQPQEKQVKQDEQSTETATQIITSKPKDLAGSVLGTISFRVMAILWIIAMIVAVLAIMFALFNEPKNKND